MSDELLSKIGNELATKTSGFKYQKTQRRLIKKDAKGWQAIAISFRKHSDGRLKLKSFAQVRISDLCDLYEPFHLYDQGSTKYPTLSVNCDNYIGGGKVTKSFDLSSMEELTVRYTLALKEKILPLLDLMYCEQSLFDNFFPEDPENWFTSDRLTRNIVLLSLAVKRNEPEVFDQIAEQFEQWCKSDQQHIVHLPLVESITSGLRSRMVARQSQAARHLGFNG